MAFAIIATRLAPALCLAYAAGCSAVAPSPAAGENRNIVRCEEPRPQICTQEYLPVCALRDTGIRCVTTPCDSTEWKTYANGCGACSDPKVEGYIPGDCEAGMVLR
ncbi:MAG: hypothetical protein ACU826_05005 [Gammaproteobacteria bacterium]